MNGERFIEVKSEVRVVIDKRLIDELGIPEDEVRRFVENRLASLSHRFSTWITETITSSLMLSKSRRKKPVTKDKKPENVESKPSESDLIEVIEKNGTLYLIPNETYRRYSKAKRYLLHEGRLIPIEMNVRRGIKNPDAIAVLREVLSKHGRVRLKIVKANSNQVILAVPDEGESNAEGKNRPL